MFNKLLTICLCSIYLIVVFVIRCSVLPSLLLSLTSERAESRRGALSCLKALVKSTDSFLHRSLLRALVKKSEEISSDSQYAAEVCTHHTATAYLLVPRYAREHACMRTPYPHFPNPPYLVDYID